MKILNKIKWKWHFYRTGYPHHEYIFHIMMNKQYPYKGCTKTALTYWINFGNVEQTANDLNCTRERVRQCLLKVMRTYK